MENQETQRIWPVLSLVDRKRDGWDAASVNITSVAAQILREDYL